MQQTRYACSSCRDKSVWNGYSLVNDIQIQLRMITLDFSIQEHLLRYCIAHKYAMDLLTDGLFEGECNVYRIHYG